MWQVFIPGRSAVITALPALKTRAHAVGVATTVSQHRVLGFAMPRRLGQHFLRAPSVERLVQLIAPQPKDVFLEIGAGLGALTAPLARRCAQIVAVEIDPTLTQKLRRAMPENVRVIEGDALALDLESLSGSGSFRIAGNLPYAVSSPLLRRLLDLHERVRDMHLMLQLEVADRVAARPGSKQYGVLSVLYALRFDVDVPLRFGPGCFVPPPKVESGILRARPRGHELAPVCCPESLEKLLHAAFAHRRKTLENNLRDRYDNLKQHLRLLNISGSRRAETLSVVEFARLAVALESDVVADE